MRIIAQRYPNGEVRVVIGGEGCTSKPSLGDRAEEADEGDGRLPPILTLGPNSEPGGQVAKAGFGGMPSPVRFGVNARRTLLRAGGALEAHGVRNEELVFLTGTLPGSSRESFVALQCYSSYAVDLTKSKLSKVGCRSAYSMYCWELQKRGALHLHYCLHIPCGKTRENVLQGWKKMWMQVIDAIGRKAECDMWDRGNGETWQHDKEVLQAPAQVVRKCVGSYLSKYLSKSSNPLLVQVYGEARYLGPVRWYGVSRPLLKLVSDYSDKIELTGITVGQCRKIREELLSQMEGMDANINRYKDKSGASEVIVSYSKENADYVYLQIAELLTPGWRYRGSFVKR